MDNADKKTIPEPEDKAIAKLAISYGVLRRLGFSEERVEECLRSSSVGLDLEDAYEWVSNCFRTTLGFKLIIGLDVRSLYRGRIGGKT